MGKKEWRIVNVLGMMWEYEFKIYVLWFLVYEFEMDVNKYIYYNSF